MPRIIPGQAHILAADSPIHMCAMAMCSMTHILWLKNPIYIYIYTYIYGCLCHDSYRCVLCVPWLIYCDLKTHICIYIYIYIYGCLCHDSYRYVYMAVCAMTHIDMYIWLFVPWLIYCYLKTHIYIYICICIYMAMCAMTHIDVCYVCHDSYRCVLCVPWLI